MRYLSTEGKPTEAFFKLNPHKKKWLVSFSYSPHNEIALSGILKH